MTGLVFQDITATGGGTDYTPPAAVATFTGGQAQAWVDLIFTIISDDFVEDKETFTITLDTVTANDATVITSPSVSTVYIEDETG